MIRVGLRPAACLLGVVVLASTSLLVVVNASAAAGDIVLASTTDAGLTSSGESIEPSLSGDGSIVAFRSQGRLDPTDTDPIVDIYVKNLTTGDISLASTSNQGVKGNGPSWRASLSSDGTRVAFRSKATNLDPGDTDLVWDIYVKDMVTGHLTLVSATQGGTKGNGDSDDPVLSPDGTQVAFDSTSTNLDPADTDPIPDIYVKDLVTGALTLASTTQAGVKGDGYSQGPSLSADGGVVAFRSQSDNLNVNDADTTQDIYVKDLGSGTLILASTTEGGTKGNGGANAPQLSADGNRVLFRTDSSNLDPIDTDSFHDIYLKDLLSGSLQLVSTTASGVKANDSCYNPSLSADASEAAFACFATNLDPNDVDPLLDIFVKDIGSGVVSLASAADDGTKTNGNSFFPSIAKDGSSVAFRSDATNLDPADTSTNPDIYVKQLHASSTGPPTISDFAPTSGPAGTPVVITGTNFTTATDVKFHGLSVGPGNFHVDSDTQITTTVPVGATTGPIAVSAPGGTATSSGTFTVPSSGSAPTITSFTPTSGAAGTLVTVNGTNFTASAVVEFNGVTGTGFVFKSATKVKAKVPAGATSGPISVTTASGTATSASNFTVPSGGPPTITSFSPSSGPVGTSVTITGTNFTGTTVVKFNGVKATFTVNSDTTITATVPAGATTGKIIVKTPLGKATSPAKFTVT